MRISAAATNRSAITWRIPLLVWSDWGSASEDAPVRGVLAPSFLMWSA